MNIRFLVGCALIFFTVRGEVLPVLQSSKSEVGRGELPIVIVTASYNNAQWYQWNLDSVFEQKYSNWHMIYIDDCSPDGTGELVKSYVHQKGFDDHVTIVCNQNRRGAMANQYTAIHACDPTCIIVILDGDDRFTCPDVLSYINNIYSNTDTWLTYGQFKVYPTGDRGFCVPMPDYIVANNAFRQFEHIPSHLRTFYAGLFHKIKKEDLMYGGEFLLMNADIAVMFPMIEMARDHFKFIPDVLLEYNEGNPLNDYKVSVDLQRYLCSIIRSMPRYDKIESPF